MSQQNIELGIKLRWDGREVDAGVDSTANKFNTLSTAVNATRQAAANAGGAFDLMGMPKLAPTIQQVDKLGDVSKQTAFAMRMLPAQMTDIAVGLASGQSPFMVLMQQGGQLKDMFGGIGPALSAVGASVAGMVNPFTIAAGVAAALGYALSTLGDDAEAAGARLHRALVEDTDKVVAALQTQIDKYEERNRYANMGVALDDSVATLAARVSRENDGYRERVALLAKISASPGADPAWLAAQQQAGEPQIAALTKAIAANNAELDKAVGKQRELNDVREAGKKVGAGRTAPAAQKSDIDRLLELGDRNLADALDAEGEGAQQKWIDERNKKDALEAWKTTQKQADEMDKLRRKYLDMADPLQKYRDQLAEIEQLRQSGDLSDEKAAAASHGVALALDEQIDKMYGLRDAGKEVASVDIVIGNAFQSLGDKLADFVTGGKVSFGDLVNSMVRDLIRLEAQASLTSIWKSVGGVSGLLRDGFGVGGFSKSELANANAGYYDNAQGGVYASPSLHAYVNTIVDKPTLFNFSQGGAIGRMGEKIGSPGEAIMPLARMSGGDLGVKVAGGGAVGPQSVRVEVVNQSSQPVRASQVQPEFDAEGMVVRLFLTDMRNNGPMRQSLGNAFNLRGA